jgi:hypothetical protein
MTQMTGNMALTSARVDPLGRNNSLEDPRTLTRSHGCVKANNACEVSLRSAKSCPAFGKNGCPDSILSFSLFGDKDGCVE